MTTVNLQISEIFSGQGVIKSSAAPRPAPTFAARPRPKSPIKLPTQGRELIERALENKASPKRVASPIKELLSSPKRIAAAHISSFEGARQRYSKSKTPLNFALKVIMPGNAQLTIRIPFYFSVLPGILPRDTRARQPACAPHPLPLPLLHRRQLRTSTTRA